MLQPSPHVLTSQYDLLGYSTNGQLQLVVEIKARVQKGAIVLAREWLHKVGQEQPSLYALFVTPEFILLRLPSNKRLASPVFVAIRQASIMQLYERLPNDFDYAVNAMACLDVAIDTQRIPLQKLVIGGLERVINSWLNSVLLLPAGELQQQPAQSWLVESGLHEVLANGTIVATLSGLYSYGVAA